MLGHSHVIPGMVMGKKAPITPAKIIFHRMYQIRVSGIHLVTEGELERFGTATTGNLQEDRAIASSVRDVSITIAGMAMILADGATFALVDARKADEIFEVIQDHLLAWAASIDQSFNRRNAPVDGLRELERLAEYLYPYAMRQRKATGNDSHLNRSLREMISRRSHFRLQAKKEVKSELEEVIPAYKPLAGKMEEKLERRNGT